MEGVYQMATRTRYFVITSLLVLAVGLGTGLVAFYVGLPGVAGGLSNPTELDYVPQTATIVAYAEVREIMISDVRQRIRRIIPMQEDGQRTFREQTGIDIESDIDHVVASLEPQADGKTAGLVLARGRFNDVSIETLMRQHGAEVEDYRGKRLIVRSHASGTDGESFALSFVEPGLIAIGNAPMVRAAIDLQESGANIRANKELMGLLASLQPGQAWVVGRVDALGSGRLPSGVLEKLPAIAWFSASGQVDSEISATVRADARDEQAANDLRDVVRGFVALAKLQSGSRPELQAALQSLELGGTGNSVALSFSIPGEVFDTLPPRQ
jgi:hypothetical protein